MRCLGTASIVRGYNLHLMQSREIKTLNYKLSTLNYT